MKSAEVSMDDIDEKPGKETSESLGNDAMEKLSQYTEDDLRISGVLESATDSAIKEELEIALRMIKAGRALDYFACMKSFDKLVADLSKSMIPFANKAYLDGVVPAGFKIKKYTPSRKWEYPKELADEFVLVKAKMKAAEKTGEAKDVTPPFDPLKSKMFAVGL